MDRRYLHLNGAERGVILAEYRRRASLRAIGVLLGRSTSMFGRELRWSRPEGKPGRPYCAELGSAGYRALRPATQTRAQKLAARLGRGKPIHRR